MRRLPRPSPSTSRVLAESHVLIKLNLRHHKEKERDISIFMCIFEKEEQEERRTHHHLAIFFLENEHVRSVVRSQENAESER
jgi:hypothetical protein